MKSIQSAFKAAQEIICRNPVFRLANEWRDSLYYSALAVSAGEAILSGDAKSALHNIVAGIICREIFRGYAWKLSPSERLVGDKSVPIDHKKNAYAAWVVSDICCVVGGGLLVRALGFFGGGLDYMGLRDRGAGMRDIPHLYFNKDTGMWNWPKKEQGGGMTQTQKLKDAMQPKKLGDAIAGFGRSLTTVRAPLVPARVPVLVPVRAPRSFR